MAPRRARRLPQRWAHLAIATLMMQRVLAAMQAKVDYLVTLNRKHFMDDPDVALQAGLRIGTPGDALRWVRRQISAEGQ